MGESVAVGILDPLPSLTLPYPKPKPTLPSPLSPLGFLFGPSRSSLEYDMPTKAQFAEAATVAQEAFEALAAEYIHTPHDATAQAQSSKTVPVISVAADSGEAERSVGDEPIVQVLGQWLACVSVRAGTRVCVLCVFVRVCVCVCCVCGRGGFSP